MGFTQVFGGGPVQPSNQLYVQLQLTPTNTQLAWPIESAQTTAAVGDLMDITQTGAGQTMQMPNAQQGSQGLTTFINNLGAYAFNLLDNLGNVILTSAPGTVWMVYLASNTTQQGTWRAYQFGAQNASVNVAALAGAGLQVVNQALAQAMENVTLSTSYASSITDLATTFIWNGGSGTFTLPLVGSINSDWFIKIVNAGSGNLTVTPQAGTIDNNSTKQFAPGGTGFVFNDGTNFWSLGYGTPGSPSGFGYINVALPASGTYTLSGAQLNQISYLLTGAITGNVTLVVPASVQQYWINNQTTGGFLVTVETASPGATVNVAPGSQVILYSDGTNIISAVTGTSLPILISQGGTGASSASAARTNLGISSVGNNIVTAASQAAAQSAMGAGATGAAVFTSANTAEAWAGLISATVPANGLYALGGGTIGLAVGSQAAQSISTALQTQLFEPSFGISALANAATYTSDTFTGTLNGVSGSVTGTVKYVRIGPQVLLTIPVISGAGTGVSLSISGVPSDLWPPATVAIAAPDACFYNNATQIEVAGGHAVEIQVLNNGNVFFLLDGGNTWSGTGTRGTLNIIAISYSLL